MSFLPYYCHSFRISFIPSVLLSFLPYYCHSFHIIVTPSELLSFLLNYCHFKYLSSWISPIPSHTRRVRKLAGRAGHIFELIIVLHLYLELQTRRKWMNLLHIFVEPVAFSNPILLTIPMAIIANRTKVAAIKMIILFNLRSRNPHSKISLALGMIIDNRSWLTSVVARPSCSHKKAYSCFDECMYTVLHIFKQVLFWVGNNGHNHKNFDPSLLSYKCWLIFIGMKKKNIFLKKQIQKGRLKKNWDFQLSQFSIFFAMSDVSSKKS